MSFTFSLVTICSALLSQTNTEPQPRSYHRIGEDLSAHLKAEATAKSDKERLELGRELVSLAQEIRSDARYINSETLQGYQLRIWTRLRAMKARAADTLKNASKASKSSGNRRTGPTYAGPTNAGPTYAGPNGAAGGGAVPNYAQELIELIESTISPGFWDVSGGPGAIRYYYPVQALVVRATSEVHENIGGVLGGLRDAGK